MNVRVHDAIYLSAVVAVIAIAGCSAQQQAAVQADISTSAAAILSTVQAACVDAGPVLGLVQGIAAPTSSIGVTAGILSGACSANGTVVPTLTPDNTTAGWIGSTTQVLKELAATPGASTPK